MDAQEHASLQEIRTYVSHALWNRDGFSPEYLAAMREIYDTIESIETGDV